MQLDLHHVVFSNHGGYLSINHSPWTNPLGEGLYLRTHVGRGRKGTRELYLLEVTHAGEVIAYHEHCTPSLLTLSTDRGRVEICLPGTCGMRVRTVGVGLRLRAVHDAKILHQPRPDGAVVAHGKGCEADFFLHAASGQMQLSPAWQLREGRNRGINFSHAQIDVAANSEFSLIECDSGPTAPDLPPFDDAVTAIAADWDQWLADMPQPTLPDWTDGHAVAAYIDWCSVVSPRGLYAHPVMVMNKTHMDQVWSWDHCFNAMACCSGRPELAWAQFMAIADHQDAKGCLPDSANQHMTSRTFTKPPIHGWAYHWCWQRNPDFFGNSERLRQTYAWMSAWSQWWLTHATWGETKLPFYIHGNNSGWDNATIFDVATPTISPDCAAYLSYQCDVLAQIAEALGMPSEASEWRTTAEAITSELIETLWRDDQFVGQVASTGQTVTCQSLITCMPIILGQRLPETIRQALANQIESFLTDYGLASEHPTSPEFHQHEHAYWRSSVWPPPVMIAVSGLRDAGFPDLAQRISERYCRATAGCVFRENHDPLTGAGRSDYAFTWTASVSMILANEYQA